MRKIVLDAMIPISFTHHKIDLLNRFITFCESSDYKIIMSEGNYNECESKKIKQSLTSSSAFKKVKISQDFLAAVKSDCLDVYKPIHTKRDNDYRVIATAMKENADYLVTNDWDLFVMAKEYKNKKGIPKDSMTLLKPTNLLWLMYSQRRDLFDWKQNISYSLKLYHHVDIENTISDMCRRINIFRSITEVHKSVENDKLDYIERAKKRFHPYGQNIYQTINKV